MGVLEAGIWRRGTLLLQHLARVGEPLLVGMAGEVSGVLHHQRGCDGCKAWGQG